MSRLRPGLVLSAALLLWGCASVGSVSYPQVAGTYEGELNVEGQGIPGALEVAQEGDALAVWFESPSMGLAAEGSGSVGRDRSARVLLEYDLQCPGQAVMTGEFTRDGRGFSGTVEASDCTGSVSGTFSFRR